MLTTETVLVCSTRDRLDFFLKSFIIQTCSLRYGFKAAIVAAWQAPFTILVGLVFAILAVVLRLWCEMLDKDNKVRELNKRNIMKTKPNGRKTVGDTRKVKEAVAKVAAAVLASIAGRCLLP